MKWLMFKKVILLWMMRRCGVSVVMQNVTLSRSDDALFDTGKGVTVWLDGVIVQGESLVSGLKIDLVPNDGGVLSV